MTPTGQSVFRQFNVAFALMGLIPLCITFYVLAARLFTIDIFEGLTGLYFLIAIVIALLGFLIGRRIIESILARLVDANEQLRRYDLMRLGFIANVAYEFRPPLSAVQISMKNLADGLLGPLTDSQRQTAQNCHEIVRRLERLTADLIDVTDTAQGSPRLDFAVFALQDMVRDAVRAADASLRAQRLAVTMRLPDQPVLFFGDRAKLQQAFHGLLDQALHWSAPGRGIRIELSTLPQELRLILSHGMDSGAAQIPPAPDPSLRPGDSEQPLELGLRLAKGIVESHHGKFWTEDRPGEDRRLVLSLPVLEPHA